MRPKCLVAPGAEKAPAVHRGPAVTFLGALPRMTERAWMDQVVGYARLMGWRVYHTWDSRHSAAGFPDLVMVRRPRVVFAELKAQRTPVTEDQRAWLEDLRASGQEARLWRPSQWAEVEEVLK